MSEIGISISIDPLVGVIIPSKSLMKVVFPLPLGPNRPKPLNSRSKFMSLTAIWLS